MEVTLQEAPAAMAAVAATIILFTRNKKEAMMIDLFKKQKINKQAQSTLEYAVFIVVIVAALAMMNKYVIRSINAGLKMTENKINAEQERNTNTTALIPPTGGGGGGGGGTCFVAGTKVSLADGSTKPIEQIKKGEMVLGYDGKEIKPAKVIQTFAHPKRQGYRIITTEEGQRVKVTGNHPLFNGKVYRVARRFKVGDSLFMLKDNKLQPVKIKAIEIKNEIVDVYNLHIDKLRNYFAEGILCHNSKPPEDSSLAQK
jgi:hypothetical protein